MVIASGIGAVATIGGSVASSSAQKSAANTASAAQTAANDKAIAAQQAQYQQTRSDLGGYRDAGSAALSQQMNLLGLGGSTASAGSAGTPDYAAYVQANPDLMADYQKVAGKFGNDMNAYGQYHYSTYGQHEGRALPMSGATSPTAGVSGADAQQQAISQLQNSPLYESLFRNGQNTLLANASATGGLRGGNTQSSLANFGRDTLSQVIESQLTRLGGVAAQGENAAAQTGQFGANAANQTSQLQNNTGAAQANAAYAVGGANSNMINSITGAVSGLANNSSVQNWVGKLF